MFYGKLSEIRKIAQERKSIGRCCKSFMELTSDGNKVYLVAKLDQSVKSPDFKDAMDQTTRGIVEKSINDRKKLKIKNLVKLTGRRLENAVKI